MRYRAQRLEITDKCFEFHGSKVKAIDAGLEKSKHALASVVQGYPDKKYVIEIYVEDK